MALWISYVKAWIEEQKGQDLAEYALLIGLIALLAVGAITAAGGSVLTIMQNIADELETAADAFGG